MSNGGQTDVRSVRLLSTESEATALEEAGQMPTAW